MSPTRKRTHHGRLIDTSVRITTTPARAWAAWADPEAIANWFVDRAEGIARPGEVMTWFFDTFNYRVPVPIIEAEPGSTFVTGSGDQPGPQGLPYLMEITITREGGDTVVRLLNSGFSPDAKFDDEFEGVVSGWKMALETMKHWLERYDTSVRTHVLIIEPATYDWRALRPLFSTSEGRRSWLPALVSRNADPLVDTGREVLLAWPEQAATIGLKAFRMGPQQVVALDVSTWNGGAGLPDDVSSQLNASLVRLKSLLG